VVQLREWGEVLLNLSAQGYYAQLIAKFRQNVIDGCGGSRRSRTMKQPDRYAVELVIFGLLNALVKSKAVEANILEHHVLMPLFHHMQAHESYKNKAPNEQERARHREISFACMTWHAHLENVLNRLK
jgi:hypothetical protein